MVLIALAFTSLASGGFFAGLLKPAPMAAARELRELLVDAVRARSEPDASRADELIEELAEAKVPFRAELLGASSSVEAIVASSDRDSPLWRACYSSGPTPRWEKNAKALGAFVDNRAGQAYDAKGQRVCNYGEVFGPGCYFTADGSFAPVDAVKRCPKDFTVAIEQGGLVVLGRPFISDAISGAGYLRVLYLDDEIRWPPPALTLTLHWPPTLTSS